MSDSPHAEILAALGKLSGGMATLSAQMTTLDSRVGAIEEAQTTLRVDLMARMDRLQNAITAQQDDQIVNYGSVERVEGIARGAAAEARALGEVVGGMQRQILRLQTQVRELRGEH